MQDKGKVELARYEVNILLVDDRADRLLSYEVALSSLGYNLVRAQSGLEALEKLMKMEFATIILDVSMPEMDGFETASVIRSHPRFEETPIIFVTGVQITEFDQRKGYELGAVDYIQIPFVTPILRGKVQSLVQLYLHKAELSRLNSELANSNENLYKANEKLKFEKMQELEQLNGYLERVNDELKLTNERLLSEIEVREKAELALQEAAERKDQYIAILAHELRNPLSSIHNAVQVMQLDDVTDEQMTWTKSLLQRQVHHLTCLMDDLLDVSRITSGRIELRRDNLDIKTVVQNAVDTLKPLFEKLEHDLILDLPDDACLVHGDLVRLTQILDNLLTNAAKYTDPGGKIYLNVAIDTSGWVEIRVRDEGVGIHKELIGQVFDLFVQAKTALNRAQGGLGIGLALVRALVEQHGGEINVYSEGHGKGAEFRVRLPTVKIENTSKEKQIPASQISLNQGVMRVLLVDDNIDSVSALEMCLKTQGFDTLLTNTGLEGLAAAERYQPHVILLDIGLPDIEGYEVARRIRDSQEMANTVLIAMTGYSAEKDKKRAKASGFNHFMVKPLDFSRLLHLMEQCASAQYE